MLRTVIVLLIFVPYLSCVKVSDRRYINKDEYERLFFKCLEEAPKSSHKIHYNDRSEVIDRCDDIAWRLSQVCEERKTRIK